MKVDAPDVEYPAEVYWGQKAKFASLDPFLAGRLRRIFDQLRIEGYQPHIVYGWRSHGAQALLLEQDRSWTQWSKHNVTDRSGRPCSRAADVIMKGEDYGWDGPKAPEFFRRLGELAKEQCLEWGGDWAVPDPSHVEMA